MGRRTPATDSCAVATGLDWQRSGRADVIGKGPRNARPSLIPTPPARYVVVVLTSARTATPHPPAADGDGDARGPPAFARCIAKLISCAPDWRELLVGAARPGENRTEEGGVERRSR